MALDYFLELEGETPDWEACIQSLKRVGLIDLVVENGRFKHANLANSGMYCWSAAIEDGDTPIIHATGDHRCRFDCWYSIIFRVSASELEECVDDVRNFCTELATASAMGFVLSSQLEDVFATRDERGLLWTWDDPR